MKKSIKTIISVVLVIALLGTSCVFATDRKPALEQRDTGIYWIKNQNVFDKLFDMCTDNIGEVPVKDAIRFIKGNHNTQYSLTIGDKTIMFEGATTIEEEKSILYRTGILKGFAEFCGSKCEVRAVVFNTIDDSILNAGISIMPIEAKSLDDCVFLGVGDSLPRELFENGEGYKENPVVYKEPDETRSWVIPPGMEDDYAYTLKASHNTSFPTSAGVSGTGSTVKLWYNTVYQRAAVAVYSKTAALENYFVPDENEVVFVNVNTMKVGLRTKGSGGHHIVNVHDYPGVSGWSSLSNVLTNTFINTILDMIKYVIKPTIAQVAVTAFQGMLSSLPNQPSSSATLSTTGTNAYVNYNFAQTCINYRNAKFDSEPMVIEFNVGAHPSGTYGFAGYCEMEYFVLINDLEYWHSTGLSISVPNNEAASYSIVINNQ